MKIRNTSKQSGAWGTKWRARLHTLLPAALFTGGIGIIAAGVFFILNTLLEQRFLDWLYSRFFVDMGFATFLNGGKWHVYDLKWEALKAFLYAAGAVAAALWVGSVAVTSILVRRHTRHQTSQELERLMRHYFAREDKSIFPRSYENMADYTVLLKERFQTSEEKLRAESGRKNDLVAYLAHDLKTPLTSVIGYLSLLREAPDMPPEQRGKYTLIALDKALRLESLINEFFEITRYNLQEITLEKETIDLKFLLVQLAEEFYPALEAHGKTIAIHAGEALTVQADPDKLARVFNNILKNALAYSYDNTEITIQACREEGALRVEISNFGKTIPKQKLDVIFEKFYRLDDARSSDTGGAGLGLAIAREIVTAHGGTIAVTSENQVTTFHVTLPEG